MVGTFTLSHDGFDWMIIQINWLLEKKDQNTKKYRDEYYEKALILQQHIQNEMNQLYQLHDLDFIIRFSKEIFKISMIDFLYIDSPTSPLPPPTYSSLKNMAPHNLMVFDLFTIIHNLTGLYISIQSNNHFKNIFQKKNRPSSDFYSSFNHKIRF